MGRQDKEDLVQELKVLPSGLMAKVVVVSPPTFEVRQDHMVRQFSNLGIPYCFVDSPDKDNPDSFKGFESDHNAFKECYRRNPRRGEFACYCGHMMAMETVLSSGAKYGIVMEDDLKINRAWPAIQEIFERQVAEAPDMDLFYPGNLLFDHSKKISADHGNIFSISKPPVGTQCYIISERLARHISSFYRVFYRPIDELFRIFTANGDDRWNYYMAKPEDRWVSPDYSFTSEITK